MTVRGWLRLSIPGLVLLTPLSALAATPTFYATRAAFLGALDPTKTVTDNYSNPGYVFVQSDAAMTAVLNQTAYTTTGFANNNIVQSSGTPSATYCAGCNGSFRLTFTNTTVGSATGVFGAAVDVVANSAGLPYFAFVTFGDNTCLL